MDEQLLLSICNSAEERLRYLIGENNIWNKQIECKVSVTFSPRYGALIFKALMRIDNIQYDSETFVDPRENVYIRGKVHRWIDEQVAPLCIKYLDSTALGRNKNTDLLFNNPRRFEYKKVIFNDPATIVYWIDGTRTVVKCQPGDDFDREKGLALCFMKRALGGTSRNLNDILHKEIDENECDGKAKKVPAKKRASTGTKNRKAKTNN